MRLQARKPIIINNKILGGPMPLICVPIVSKNKKELEKDLNKVIETSPDMIEWRVDFFEDACNLIKTIDALRMFRSIIGETPLIFTFRSSLEGGSKQVNSEARWEIIEQVINTGKIDIVDVELISGKAIIDKIKAATIKHNVALILSYHNFEKTPSIEFMVNKMEKQVLSGADIAKVAVMPNNEGDVLNLLLATLKARESMPDTPLITMSMGKLGIVTRLAGGIFGSDLTFGAHGNISAPGQIAIIKLKEIIELLYDPIC